MLKQAEAGTPVPQLCRWYGVSSATFHKRRSKFGGMDASLMSQLKELQDENRLLQKMYADAQLGAELLKEAMAKMVRPSQRREMVRWAVEKGRTSIRRACQTFALSGERLPLPSQGVRGEHAHRGLAGSSDHGRDWSFGLCFLRLRNVKGYGWNHKRVYRIYPELELNLRIKPRKWIVRERPEPLMVPAAINQVWSIGFMHDQLSDG